MSDNTLAKLEAEVDRADRALSEIKQERSDAEMAAILAIREEYANREREAAHRLSAARVARLNHLDATSTHEWEGRRVVRTVSVFIQWSGRVLEKRQEYGVVQICKSGTEFPANQTWGIPKVGEAFVRIELKSGKLGKKFARLNTREWSLAEGGAQ